MFVELLFSKLSKTSVTLTILLPCNSSGVFFLDRKRNKCWLAAYSYDLLIHISINISRSASWLIAQLCRICYKYCGIGRYRLSVLSLQIGCWLSTEKCENSVSRSSKQIPLRVLHGSHRKSSLFDRFDKISDRLRFYCTMNRSSPLNCTLSFFKCGILLQQPIAPLVSSISQKYFK